MERSGRIYAVILLLLLCFWDLSSAWSLRSLIDAGSKENPSTKNISPLPSPVSAGNRTNTTSAHGDKPKKEDIQKPIKDSPKVDQDPKVTNQTVNSTETHVTPPSKDKEQVDKKGKDDKKKDNTNLGSGESCNDSTKSCKSGSMVACILQGLDNVAINSTCGGTFKDCTKTIVILVQNKGEVTLKVKVKQPSSEHTINPVIVNGNQTGKIDIPMSNDQTTQKVILDAGNGDCELITNNVGLPETRKEELLQQLQFYYKQMTPIYGAYMFFAVAMILGGIWGCCKLIRKKRQEGGIAYQELEMALPESDSITTMNVVAAATAEGWDEDWDDDWDEENAVKSPVVGQNHNVGNISGNGLTARSSTNRNGWEKDWDD